jgi:predicted dehydrogenase
VTPLRIGIVGAGFIARPHAQALRALREIWGAEMPSIELAVVCDENAELARAFATRFGAGRVTARWQDVTRDDALDAVLVLVPNDLHAPVALDALRHGRHVLCEKPLAESPEAAAALLAAAEDAPTAAQVAFVYRAWPAVRLARELVVAGEIGRLLEFRGRFLHDYALDPDHPFSWRFSCARAGAGSLGDLGSHVIDLARFLAGEIAAVTAARTRTIVAARPGPDGRLCPVDVDDAAELWLAFEGGAVGTIHTSWAAAGHRTDLAFELLGDAGSLRFCWQRPNELVVTSAGGPEGLGADRRITLGPAHPGALWPVPGVGLGWAEAFVLNARAFALAVTGRAPVTPSFRDGLRAAEVVAAAAALAGSGAGRPAPAASP